MVDKQPYDRKAKNIREAHSTQKSIPRKEKERQAALETVSGLASPSGVGTLGKRSTVSHKGLIIHLSL